ncbi:MAG: FMN-binding protein [Planctomycetota bacterium]
MHLASLILPIVLVLGSSAPVSAPAAGAAQKVFLTRDEALELAFPKAKVERITVRLTEEELKRAGKLAGKEAEPKERLVYAYEARRDGKRIGTAYFDAHKVRTVQEVLMFVVGEKQTIERVEMLAFAEPLDYIPRGSWYKQFVGRKLDDQLQLKKGIRAVTGATLTTSATTRAARRVLALHAVREERAQKEKEKAKKKGSGG